MPSLYDHLSVFRLVEGDYGPDTPFDDTVLTYGSDFVLAAVMAILAVRIAQCPDSDLRVPSIVLVSGYAISTFLGGILHAWKQFGLDLNGWAFRTGWFLTVGLVASTNGTFGVIGNALRCVHHTKVKRCPQVFDGFWIIYGALLILGVSAGCFRCARPAADIFLVGTCQTLSTIYVVLQLTLNRWLVKQRWVAAIIVGMISNAQLLFAYPVLVLQNYSLGVINLYLHSTLLYAWSLQGIGLLAFCQQASTRMKIEVDRVHDLTRVKRD